MDMNCFKRIIIVILAFSAIFSISCGGDLNDNVTTGNNTTVDPGITDAPQDNDLVIAENGKSEYTIIYSKTRTPDEMVFVTRFSSLIGKTTNIRLEYKTDSDTADSAHEILVGNTSRPETAKAKELLGDKQYIIAVINEKLVIYAIDDAIYDVLFFIFETRICEKGALILDKNYLVISDLKTVLPVNTKLERGKQISFEACLDSESSVAGIKIGEYTLEITTNHISLYKGSDGERISYASKAARLEAGKKYNFSVSFDGEYLRAYVDDAPEGYEAWQKFEVKVENVSNKEIAFVETSGYGASFSEAIVSNIPAAETGKTYQNVLMNGLADPDILYYNGYYYMYATSTGYLVFRSKDLVDWEPLGKSLPECSWDIDSKYMWAPDVEYINGKFYMAVSFGSNGFGIAVADKPEGPFTCVGNAPLMKDTIDGNIFVDDNGKVYLYYTSWYDGRKYGIWGVEMESDCVTPKWETEKLLIVPDQPWESTLNMGGITEAPFMMKKDGVYYLVYSGSHFQADYAVGYATSSSPLGRFKKTDDSPILSRTNDVRGPGHCSIVETPEGKMYMVYHVHNSADAVSPRNIAIDEVRFVPNGKNGYVIEVMGPTTSNIPV